MTNFEYSHSNGQINKADFCQELWINQNIRNKILRSKSAAKNTVINCCQ